MTSSRPRWYSSMVRRPSWSSSSVACQISSPSRAASSENSARSIANSGRLSAKTKLAVSEGENPWRARVRERSARKARAGAHALALASRIESVSAGSAIRVRNSSPCARSSAAGRLSARPSLTCSLTQTARTSSRRSPIRRRNSERRSGVELRRTAGALLATGLLRAGDARGGRIPSLARRARARSRREYARFRTQVNLVGSPAYDQRSYFEADNQNVLISTKSVQVQGASRQESRRPFAPALSLPLFHSRSFTPALSLPFFHSRFF